MDERRRDQVSWPPLQDGANEPGPTDQAGEYRAAEQLAGGLTGAEPAARVPGELRPWEQPVDMASPTAMPVEPPDGQLSEAERAVHDMRHITRGKPSMSSNEGSS